MLKKAVKAGVSIDNKTVKEYMDDIRTNLPRDKKGYEEFKQFIANSGWTEDEYWEKAFPVYKNAYIVGKYKKEYLLPQFKNKNKDLSGPEFTKKFNEYFNQLKKDIIKDAKVEYFN